MKPVFVAKILQEALRASWNFGSSHWLHHPMNVKKKKKKKKKKNHILILKINKCKYKN